MKAPSWGRKFGILRNYKELREKDHLLTLENTTINCDKLPKVAILLPDSRSVVTRSDLQSNFSALKIKWQSISL